jgi:hypothetical protein
LTRGEEARRSVLVFRSAAAHQQQAGLSMQSRQDDSLRGNRERKDSSPLPFSELQL